MIAEFSAIFISAEVVCQITTYLVAFGLFVGALEDLSAWSVYSTSGLLSGDVAQFSFGSGNNLSSLMKLLTKDSAFKLLTWARFMSAVLLGMFSYFGWYSPFLYGLAFMLHSLVAIRSSYSLDGAYQMYMMLLLGLFASSLFSFESNLAYLALGFIGAELILSYFIAGFSKLLSPVWRSGYALYAVFSTRTYGSVFIYNLLRKHKLIASILGWVVILFEVSFFLILFVSPHYAVFFLLLGFGFHLFNAIFMGLNDFLIAFPATYPALLFLVNWVHMSHRATV